MAAHRVSLKRNKVLTTPDGSPELAVALNLKNTLKDRILKGQCHEIFEHSCFGLKGSTWAPCYIFGV